MPQKRDPEVTSRIMSKVRSKDSKAELALRSELHGRGIRYRVHARDVEGTPDLVIRKYKFAVFVDGDMWHGNEHRRRGLDSLADLFPTNTEFWIEKIQKNVERDQRVNAALHERGWEVVRLWESEVLEDPEKAADRVEAALDEAREEHG